MARQAEAERERRAKIIHAEGEFQAAEKLAMRPRSSPPSRPPSSCATCRPWWRSATEQNTTTFSPLPIDLVKAYFEKLKQADFARGSPMTRPLRIEFPGALYVVTARALPRQRLFREASEVEDFVARLPALEEGFGAVFHGFSIVPDHYHLLVETPRGNLSRVLHRLNAGYTATVNARRNRTGPLLHSRYRSVVIEEEPWLVRLSVHIHLNPVRKRLARDPWEYPGSSARAFGPKAVAIPGLETSRVLGLAGGRERYGELLEAALRKPPPSPWKEVWRQTVLGGEALRARALSGLAGKDLREYAGFSLRRPEGLELSDLLALIAENTGLRTEDIVRGKFQRVLARKAALYLARRFTGLTLREIGEAFGVDYTTVHMAARRVEELRSADPAVDDFLRAIEGELRARGHGAQPPPEPPKRTTKKRPKKSEKTPEKPAPQLKLF